MIGKVYSGCESCSSSAASSMVCFLYDEFLAFVIYYDVDGIWDPVELV